MVNMTERSRIAIETARTEWDKDIEEPPKGKNFTEISKYISGQYGLNWTWEKPYVTNGPFQWCGAFVAYCYGIAGLKEEIRKERFASTSRLWNWHRKSEEGRCVFKRGKGIVPRAELFREGDIVVVGDGSKKYGNHITLVHSVLESQVMTYEGNGIGLGPDGKSHEGVVKCSRAFDPPSGKRYIMYAYRPLGEDFE